MGILSDLLGDVSSDIYGDLPPEIKATYTTPLPQIGAPGASFQPFTVTGPSGRISASAGGTGYELSQAGQDIQTALESAALSRFGAAPAGVGQVGTAAEQAMGVGGQFMGQVGMPMGAREQEVYDRIRSTQLAEEERQRLALEERLSGQGRLGVQTAMFGGTPEQFALSQAQEEAQNRASLAAIQQAQAEQQQQAAIGAQFTGLGAGLTSQQQALEAAQQQMGLGALQGAYIPQAAMLSAFSPALNVASLVDISGRQANELALEAAIANLSAQAGQQAGLSNLYTGLMGAGGGLLSGITGGATDIISSLIGRISDISLKTNVQPLGKLPNGISLYTWDWTEKGQELAGNTPTYGVIAQEVQQVIPDAVTRGDHGYLTVDYTKLI